MSIVPAGFTRLDNETDVATLLSLPNALVQPYLFLLTRARLTRAGAHWGEVAAAINRSQTQTHSALRALKERGLAEESGGSWLAVRGKSTEKPADTHREVEAQPTGNPTESHRKPAMGEAEKVAQNNENETPKEGTEGKKEIKDKNTPLTPQGVNGPDGQAKTEPVNPLAADLRPAQDSFTAPQEPSPAKGLEEVPRRRAAPAFDPLTCELPACVPAELWAEWVAHRRQIKKSLTQAAAVLTLRGLETAHNNGWDVTNLVHDAIANRWSGCVFDEQRQPNPRAAPAALPPRRNYDEPALTDDFTPRRSYE